ncbi:MAG: nuclear transport factor 2 family protein [Ignavibacteriales bacterium]|nr:nuclear transport factor 2 family protein [Ignavibacteriales bacterium]
MITTSANFATNDTLAQKIIAMEKSALDRWGQGDPSGFLEISAEDVVYFDPFQERRLNGRSELKQLYEGLRGTIHIDRYEMLNPIVQSVESIAVLTFNLVSYEKEKVYRWNCTEVYQLQSDGQWKIVQTHWSFTKPNLKLD